MSAILGKEYFPNQADYVQKQTYWEVFDAPEAPIDGPTHKECELILIPRVPSLFYNRISQNLEKGKPLEVG